MSTFELAVDELTRRACDFAEFYGRVRGVMDCRDENYLNDFDALMRIRELIALHEQKQEKRLI
jgi:hypothetical protein